MTAPISLQVVTPRRVVEECQVSSIVVPGSDGYMGIWPRHAPAMVALKPGILRYRIDQEQRSLAISGGFVEVNRDQAVVLADAAERPDEIDVQRALAARQRAEERLRKPDSDEVDYTRAMAALERALVRLRLAGALDGN